MHAGEQQGLDDGPLPGRVGLTRGLLVIVTAVVIGGFVLARGITSGNHSIAAADGATTLSAEGSVDDDGATAGSTANGGATGASGPGTGTPPATTVTLGAATTVTAKPTGATTTTTTAAPTATTVNNGLVTGPGSVTVLVLNAASGKGIAGKGSQMLASAGYQVMAPKNADTLGPSKIYFTTGHEADAKAVAQVFKVDPASLVAPLNPSSPPIATIGDAKVIVVVGNDGVIRVSGA